MAMFAGAAAAMAVNRRARIYRHRANPESRTLSPAMSHRATLNSGTRRRYVHSRRSSLEDEDDSDVLQSLPIIIYVHPCVIAMSRGFNYLSL